MPLRQWIRSANNAIEGILHATGTQRHVRYHFYSAAGAVLLSYALGLSRNEFLFVALAAVMVIVAELFNTAVEAVVDILAPEYHERARHAKDVAAGAVLVTAVGALLIAYAVIFPHLERAFASGLTITSRPAGEVAVLAFIIVMIIVVLVKARYGRGTPLSGGMPSGHAAIAFSAWAAVSMATRSYIASALCLALAVMIAQSRVSTRVHRPVEVLAGAVLGLAVTLLLFWVFS